MSCEQPVHSASQSELRSQILRDANNQYNSHIRALDASTQDDSAKNIQIVELMEQMLQNNIDNADGKIVDSNKKYVFRDTIKSSSIK